MNSGAEGSLGILISVPRPVRSDSNASSASSKDSDSTSSSSADAEFAGSDSGDEAPKIPDYILGRKVHWGRQREASMWGVRVWRKLPGCPPKCARYRSVRLGQDRWGPTAAAMYLGAWLRAGERDDLAVPHTKYNPTTLEIDNYAESVGAA